MPQAVNPMAFPPAYIADTPANFLIQKKLTMTLAIRNMGPAIVDCTYAAPGTRTRFYMPWCRNAGQPGKMVAWSKSCQQISLNALKHMISGV